MHILRPLWILIQNYLVHCKPKDHTKQASSQTEYFSTLQLSILVLYKNK